MREYGLKLAHVLDVSMSNNFSVKCVKFLEYLVGEVVQLHSNDRHQQPQRIIDGFYNPEKGTAYYFTPHGNQVRQQGKYFIDSTNKKYDDVPSVDEICIKKFPPVSCGGFGYMFLWFCPVHGHCYGFHLISGAEGKKHPFSAIFKYLSNAPLEIFYDIACQYSEYCLNKEPQYFQNTRFWHDLFHGISHKCGKTLSHLGCVVCQE